MPKGEFGEPWAESHSLRGYIDDARGEVILGDQGIADPESVARAIACANALDGKRPERLDRLLLAIHTLLPCDNYGPELPAHQAVVDALAAFEGEEPRPA